jgi:uncharacterized membrane protein YidH (DUF202 family)
MNNLESKYRFSFFSMFDYKSIEDNLALMAEKGWRIDHISAFLWKFKRANPSERKFAVVLSGNDSEYKPICLENQEMLEEICIENGWEKEIQWKQMQIFSANKDAIPMETDEAVRIENIHLSMKKTFIPSWLLAILTMLILLTSNSMKYFGNSPYCDEDTVWVLIIASNGAFMIGVALLGYIFWLQASRKKIAEGGTCISAAWHRRLLNILMIGFLIILLAFFADTKMQLGQGLVLYIIIYMAGVLAVISVSNFLSQYLKGKRWSSRSNIILSITVAVILIIGMVVITNIIGA